jgi:hypothetical protein
MTVDAIEGDNTKAVGAVAQWFAEANLIYTNQVNMVLEVGQIVVSADGAESWNNEGCTEYWDAEADYPDISKQLQLFGDWEKPAKCGPLGCRGMSFLSCLRHLAIAVPVVCTLSICTPLRRPNVRDARWCPKQMSTHYMYCCRHALPGRYDSCLMAALFHPCLTRTLMLNNRYALWHMFDDCFAPPKCKCDGGTAGLANLDVLCNDGANVGITYYTGLAETW